MVDYLPYFVGVTAAAVVLQAGILVGLFLAVRKTATRVEALAAEVQTKVLPTVDIANSMLKDLRPKIETMVLNVSESSTMVREQIERIDATVSDVIDRARLQVIRADELVNGTMDRLEQTRDVVHKTVISPIRQISGLVQGVTAGLEFLIGMRRRRRHEVTVPQDEMFI
jgi:methyl-accepting chemotaxis protein